MSKWIRPFTVISLSAAAGGIGTRLWLNEYGGGVGGSSSGEFHMPSDRIKRQVESTPLVKNLLSRPGLEVVPFRPVLTALGGDPINEKKETDGEKVMLGSIILDGKEDPSNYKSHMLRGNSLYGEGKIEYAFGLLSRKEKVLVKVAKIGKELCGHPEAIIFNFGKAAGQYSGFTANLDVNYRMPMPAPSTIAIVVWIDRIEGRKVYMKAEAHACDPNAVYFPVNPKARETSAEVARWIGDKSIKFADATSLYIIPKDQYERTKKRDDRMASILITLTAVAVYKYVKARRSSRSPEALLINKCFPKELQQQILNDFDECISTFAASRYEKHQKVLQLFSKQQAEFEKEQVALQLQQQQQQLADAAAGRDGDGLDTGGVAARVETPKKSRFSFLTRKPGPKASSPSPSRRGSNSPTPTPSLPSLPEPPAFDPASVRMEGQQALLLLWALVDGLKKGINREVFAGSETTDDENSNGSTSSVDSANNSIPNLVPEDGKVVTTGPESMDSRVPGADDGVKNGDGLGPAAGVDATAEEMPPLTLKEREFELIQPLDTGILISLLQILHSVESVLLDRFMFLRDRGVESIPQSLNRRRSSTSSIKGDASNPDDATITISIADAACDGYILQKISLGWGFVNMLLEATDTMELRDIVMQNQGMMDARMDGFLVETILEVLDTRGVLSSSSSSGEGEEKVAVEGKEPGVSPPD
ncbi:hypothetical protein HDU97_000850 [Phlyctochytrium planicorne]|nr:hypothetical protein HDU97_000850 [Phlyctochytrium planicorne]